ncbi:peptidase S1, partial [Micromonospora phytophila]|nr:peptidase S1 [Micromonospora phytophila]
MTEYESDPQRRPAPTDAEPSHPTAELPRVERAQSDSPSTDAAPDATAVSAAPGADDLRTPEPARVPDGPLAGDAPRTSE